jgi:hypothetical protein
MTKFLIAAVLSAVFAFTANANEMKTKDGAHTFVVTEAGVTENGAPAADGEYNMADDSVLTVKDGKKVEGHK